MSGTVPRSAGLRRISSSRRPLALDVGGGFAFGFIEQEVQPAFAGIPIDLFVPLRLFMLPKPCKDSLVILRRQAIDSGLDLFYPVHEWILAFSRQADLPNRAVKWTYHAQAAELLLRREPYVRLTESQPARQAPTRRTWL